MQELHHERKREKLEQRLAKFRKEAQNCVALRCTEKTSMMFCFLYAQV
tara:strand:- start:148 stop:291 length:144 start_codon:yes stop_codon:yes gene_type:complete